jgi:hypothetical protein
MANQIELGKLSKHLRSALPIIGAMKRRKAVETLVAQKDEPEHVPLLLEAATGKDQKLALQARAALESLANREAKDALCALALRDANGLASQIAVAKGVHGEFQITQQWAVRTVLRSAIRSDNGVGPLVVVAAEPKNWLKAVCSLRLQKLLAAVHGASAYGGSGRRAVDRH